MKKIFALLSITALLLTACSTSSSSVTKVSAPEFLNKISASDVVILDVRTPEEFAAGHLPNAVTKLQLMEFIAEVVIDQVLQVKKWLRQVLAQYLIQLLD